MLGRGKCGAGAHALPVGHCGVSGTPVSFVSHTCEGLGGWRDWCALQEAFPELSGSLSGILFAACIAGGLSCVFGGGVLSVKSMLHWRN
jgi:hypothetical protein